MRKLLAVFLALLLLPLVLGQGKYTQKDRLGKSVDQVLAMGLDRWTNYYYTKVEFAGNNRGVPYDIYQDCLATRNAKRASTLSPARRQKVAATRKTLERVYLGLARVQYAFTGGNAWSPDAPPVEIAALTKRLIEASNPRREPRGSLTNATIGQLTKKIDRFYAGAPARIRQRAAKGELMVLYPRKAESEVQARARVVGETLAELQKSKTAYRQLLPTLASYRQREAVEMLRLVESWCSLDPR